MSAAVGSLPCHAAPLLRAAADRLLAAQLWERGVPLEAVENAFVLAARDD